MKINRLMQVVFVSGSVCAAVPAFASSALHGPVAAPSCGGDSDDDEDGDEDEDKDGETLLCGGDEGDDDGGDDDGDDGDGDDTDAQQL